MKRLIALFLVLLTLTFCGCNAVILDNGTLNLDKNMINHIRITNNQTDHVFSVAEREVIGKIIDHINSFTLDNGQDSSDMTQYTLHLVTTDGDTEIIYSVANQLFIESKTQFTVDAEDLMIYLEKLEAKTLTDRELIDSLLQGNTLEKLNVFNEDNKISVDKILALPDQCPALFELLSRPSGIETVGTYGVETIQGYLNSNNPELVKKAYEWIAVIERLMPQMKEKLENLLNNEYFSKNNP